MSSLLELAHGEAPRRDSSPAIDAAHWEQSASADAILWTDVSGRVVDANAAAAALFGASQDGLHGRSLRDLLGCQVDLDTAPWIPGRSEREVLLNIELGGRSRTVAYRPIGRPDSAAALHVLRDATDERDDPRSRMERMLRAAERVGLCGAWEVDLHAGTIWCTPELLKIYDVSTEPKWWTIEEISSFYTERSRDVVRAAFDRAVAHGTPYDIDVEIVTGQGNRKWLRETCHPTVRAGSVATIFGVSKDITSARNLEQCIATAENQERTRIGSNLHDGLGQELTGLSLLLSATARRAKRTKNPLAADLAAIAKLAARSVITTRAVAHGLLAVDLEHGGLLGALRRLAAVTRQSAGIDVVVRARRAVVGTLSPLAAVNLFRIAQEAMTNAVKHARAQRVAIHMSALRSHIEFRIDDDGRGVGEHSRCYGMGLRIMDHRARLLGGILQVVPRHPHGTTVRCVVPHDHHDKIGSRPAHRGNR